MTCSEFLQAYSEYRDGLLREPAAVTAVEAHLEGCPTCARLARAMALGLSALRDTEDVTPSRRFRTELTHRLRAEVAIGDPIAPTHAGLAAALLLAAALGLLLYESVVRPEVAAVARSEAIPVDTRPYAPALTDVTLPAFTHSALQFHSQQIPLGSYAAFTR